MASPHPTTARPAIVAETLPPASLTEPDRNRMFELLGTYFEGVERESFEADLEEKDSVVLLRDEESRAIQGFSTLMCLRVTLAGGPVTAFYSGDTIVERRFWGSLALQTAWGHHVFARARQCRDSDVYWFYVSSGYKTYRFLPVFFNEFYPTHARPTPPAAKERIDCFGKLRFGDTYDARSGIVTFPKLVPLRAGVAEVSRRELDDPHIAFFVTANPQYHRGKSLACIAQLSESNLTRAGRRVFGLG